ncbi:sulfurtransferase TusA family protein [Stygiolobus caldivivus]|uniref:Oxidoreductase n=1 Tax=Stygiolobus caldivivus TaxID=2824673 RepID=A0A8D5U445_9CREN|nr:sulfurtransferase TusA family protein [Stygiolobus caldivivus]BCU69085.1 oxidoreductase [Stygiolobus caldivivus]
MRSEVNLVGLCCSVPHLIVYNKLRKMSKGDTLLVITDDATVVQRDIIPLAEKFGCKTTITKDEDLFKIELTI